MLLNNLKLNTRIIIDPLLNRELTKLIIIPNRTKYYKKHTNPLYRKERGRKVWKVELPDFDHERKTSNQQLDPEEIRSRMKEQGIAPPTTWNERELYYPSSLTLLDPYNPDGDGQSSSLAKKVLGKVVDKGKNIYKNNRALTAIQNYESLDFTLDTFCKRSLEIYVSAHEALASKDDKRIFEFVTERCFNEMKSGLDYKTLHWEFHGTVTDPVVVQLRVGEMLSKTNKMGQITVKFHTRQKLAIYDRHGRLCHGSPNEIREVIEYLVFEKLLADEYGLWRIHDRIRKQEGKSYNQITKTYQVRAETTTISQ